MIIQTNRLILREMNKNDFNSLFTIFSNQETMKYYPYIFDEDKVRSWIDRNIERYCVFGFGLWAVCLKGSGELIGDCGLTMQNINGFIRPEIGYHIRKEMQGKGYAKEAAIAVRDWVFKNTPFNEIYSYMKSENEPSIKCAMAYGCCQVDEYIDNNNDKIKVYAITIDKWKKMLTK